jgi:hypothetical protein
MTKGSYFVREGAEFSAKKTSRKWEHSIRICGTQKITIDSWMRTTYSNPTYQSQLPLVLKKAVERRRGIRLSDRMCGC